MVFTPGKNHPSSIHRRIDKINPNGDSLRRSLREKCGVTGVFGHSEASVLTALGLHALQHRGQEAAGIVSFDGTQFHSHRAFGQVGDIFSQERIIKQLPGHLALGHNRYATHGEMSTRNIQPLFAEFSFGGFALAHNGNLTNAMSLRDQLVSRGHLFQSTTDTEVIIQLMAAPDNNQGGLKDRIANALGGVEGAYSIIAIADNCMIGARDPEGVRPLVLGRLDDAWILASESCALDIMGAEFVRDIEAGEMIYIDARGARSSFPFARRNSRFCIFEYVYFARPDSVIEGKNVYQIRKRIGHYLAKERPCAASVVVPVPDSGVAAAIGYSETSGIPFDLGIIRNHYVGRTFIEPSDSIRHFGVKLKHNANRGLLQGQDVILVDDSLVRGTTSRKIVDMVRRAGAKTVHMRIASPPTRHPCFYGIDTPRQEELLASTMDNDAMTSEIGVDSLEFLSIDGLYQALGYGKRDRDRRYCDACFTGDYPIRLRDHEERDDQCQLSLLDELDAGHR